MKFIVEGNFSRTTRYCGYIFGLLVFTASLAIEGLPRAIRILFFFLGFSLVAISGISTRAAMLKIKPFDNSYKNARRSYIETEETKDNV